MFSDKWLSQGYMKSTATKVVAAIHYSHWVDKKGRIVGVSISFEYADDYHIEFEIQAWEKVLGMVRKQRKGNSEEALLRDYFSENNRLDFMRLITDEGIKHTKMSFY